MRFNPRIIHDDEAPADEAGELLLSDDLLLLAEQLRDDAAHLSRCYGPESFGTAQPLDTMQPLEETPSGELVAAWSAMAPHARAGNWRWVVAGTTLASISLVVISAMFFVQQADQPARETAKAASRPATAIASPSDREAAVGHKAREMASPAHSTAASSATSQSPGSMDTTASRQAAAKPSARGQGEEADGLSPVLFLQEVSAPELEGWVDLLERRRDVEESDLSI